ncbi:MAG: hypothetical protein C0507_19060 [Cyanobacteria bacterium PR.3.49]|nr:hypothetical protein [Cyanobacteria bacterium PR.3.49]
MNNMINPPQIAGIQPLNVSIEGMKSATNLRAQAGRSQNPKSQAGISKINAMPKVPIARSALMLIAEISTHHPKIEKRMPASIACAKLPWKFAPGISGNKKKKALAVSAKRIR